MSTTKLSFTIFLYFIISSITCSTITIGALASDMAERAQIYIPNFTLDVRVPSPIVADHSYFDWYQLRNMIRGMSATAGLLGTVLAYNFDHVGLAYASGTLFALGTLTTLAIDYKLDCYEQLHTHFVNQELADIVEQE